MGRLLVTRFGMVIHLWWVVGWFRFMVSWFWFMVSWFWFMVSWLRFLVGWFWFMVSWLRCMISWLWLMVGGFGFNIIVDWMSKMMAVMHHVSHVWILLHVVAGHADAKHLLKTERVPCMVCMC